MDCSIFGQYLEALPLALRRDALINFNSLMILRLDGFIHARIQ
jgi:hypothetical protein